MNFILKGNIAFSHSDMRMECREQSYVICEGGICKGVFENIPDRYSKLPVYDYGNKLIIPGMYDLHLHAPQYTYRGTGMDMELLEWLNVTTFPEEARYKDTEYAKQAYKYFVEDLKESYTTRACIFATLHKEATLELMEQLEESGLICYVGKVNMDRNSLEEYIEKEAVSAVNDTEEWILLSKDKFKHIKPILTPRFIPTCSDKLMEGLGELQKKYNLRVQSHLSENLSEIEWVKELVPQSNSYGHAYDLFGMFGSKELPALMAHCVYSSKEEISLMKERGVYMVHCPESNLNVSSGIAPVRNYLNENLSIGLGTDVAAGTSLSMLKAMSLAIQMSKMYWRLIDQDMKPLTFKEVFYLATLGGGSYFGKVGSFLDGYEFDAIVVDDSKVKGMRVLNVKERVERMVYQENYCNIYRKFVAGRLIF